MYKVNRSLSTEGSSDISSIEESSQSGGSGGQTSRSGEDSSNQRGSFSIGGSMIMDQSFSAGSVIGHNENPHYLSDTLSCSDDYPDTMNI